MRIKREKKRRQDAVLRWIRSRPRIIVPEKRTEKESWKNNCECCKDKIRYITEDEPELTYP
ncbi:hypothetical protein A2U01_0093942, partial [Trifolium medium]|nr:hypothetical protein [Trifolium medium]